MKVGVGEANPRMRGVKEKMVAEAKSSDRRAGHN